MIYATIDVDLVDHEKAVLAGVAAMGLWTWGMLWLRKHKSSTGIVPAHMVVACSWGDRGTTVKLAAKLVASGLWSACEGGYLVHNYAEKNDTRCIGKVNYPGRWVPLAMRQRVRARDGLTCRLCGNPVQASDVHLDHATPLSLGGKTVDENLQVTHSRCNLLKGSQIQ